MNQTAFGAIADVTRGSQQEYESGKRPFSLGYLIALQLYGVDTTYILTGKRDTSTLGRSASELLIAFEAMDRTDQYALLQIAGSLSGHQVTTRSITLPSTSVLEDAMSGLIEEGQDFSPAELVHEIAMQLPIILQAAQHEIAAPESDYRDSAHEREAAFGGEQSSARPGRRT